MSIDPWNIFSADFGAFPKPYTAFVTLLDLAIYFVFMIKVGMAREKYKVAAPATDGPEAFNRVFRVQQNTLEQLMLHMPVLWLAAFAMDDIFAASFGTVWALGRVIYARGYYQKAKRRHKGFMIGLGATVILFVGSAASIIASF